MDKVAALRDILAQDSTNAFARYGLALEMVNSGKVADGMREFDILLAQHPDYVAGYQMAGQTMLDQGDDARARTYLERGLAAAEKTGNAHAAREISGLLDSLRD